jgi:hypothetical protein
MIFYSLLSITLVYFKLPVRTDWSPVRTTLSGWGGWPLSTFFVSQKLSKNYPHASLDESLPDERQAGVLTGKQGKEFYMVML